ncbi:MAG: hypothetical protein ACD_78C00077G0001, partial [uncultured bacterium (gcode 4)]
MDETTRGYEGLSCKWELYSGIHKEWFQFWYDIGHDGH